MEKFYIPNDIMIENKYYKFKSFYTTNEEKTKYNFSCKDTVNCGKVLLIFEEENLSRWLIMGSDPIYKRNKFSHNCYPTKKQSKMK